MKTLPRVATEMALHVLAYNLTRVMNIIAHDDDERIAKSKKDHASPHRQGRDAFKYFRQSVSTQPRPIANMGECYVRSVEPHLNFQPNAPWIVTISREIISKRHARRVMSGLLSASQL
jgi:hypothetical protein